MTDNVHSDDFAQNYNYRLKRLFTTLNEPTNQISMKVPKVVKQRISKHYYKTLGTRVINSPMSPPFLLNTYLYQQFNLLFRLVSPIRILIQLSAHFSHDINISDWLIGDSTKLLKCHIKKYPWILLTLMGLKSI